LGNSSINAYAQGDDDDDPIPTKPVAKPAAKPTVTKRPVLTSTPTVAAKVKKLPPLARRRGYVIGRAIFPDGRPIPEFDISVLGYDGQVNIFSSQGATPSLGWGKGKNGRYAIRTMDTFQHKKPVNGLVVSVQAYANLKYGGQIYKMPLYPIDGLRDGGGKGEFKANSGPGIVRDFVLKVSGLKPQFKAFDKSEIGNENGYVFYGGQLTISLSESDDKEYTTLQRTALPSSKFTFTFTPQGPLLDGSRPQPIHRVATVKGANYYIYLSNIPLGIYSMTATLTNPDGTVVPLRLNTKRENYASSTKIQFDASPSILGGVYGVNVYLVR